jgi:hypothetical protein
MVLYRIPSIFDPGQICVELRVKFWYHVWNLLIFMVLDQNLNRLALHMKTVTEKLRLRAKSYLWSNSEPHNGRVWIKYLTTCDYVL